MWWIDANELWLSVIRKNDSDISLGELLDEMEKAPSVVRCKDCKHRIPNPHGYTCKKLFIEVSLDDYCSWSERREDDKTADKCD